MKKVFSISAILFASCCAISSAMAEDAPATDAAAAPDTGPVTANVTLASQYRYRGISQTNSAPAIQGGFDYAHESGFYLGNWNSNISWMSDNYSASPAQLSPAVPGLSAPIEMDFYGGYKTEIFKDLNLDVGVLEYYYPTKNLPNKTTYTAPGVTTTAYGSFTGRQTQGNSGNTTEIYAGATYAFATFKYSYALTNLFGIDNSKGSSYYDLSLNYDTGIAGVTLNGHVGRQVVPNTPNFSKEPNFSYTDWKLGLTKDLGHGMSGAFAYISTNALNAAYFNTSLSNTGKGTSVASITKTF